MAVIAETSVPVPEPSGSKPFAPFEWMLARRYLRSRRRETFISIIAGFSFVGIMLGVATLIVVMAVMNGFRAELLTRILGINGHLIVQPVDSALNDYAETATRIAGVGNEILGDFLCGGGVQTGVVAEMLVQFSHHALP